MFLWALAVKVVNARNVLNFLLVRARCPYLPPKRPVVMLVAISVMCCPSLLMVFVNGCSVVYVMLAAVTAVSLMTPPCAVFWRSFTRLNMTLRKDTHRHSSLEPAATEEDFWSPTSLKRGIRDDVPLFSLGHIPRLLLRRNTKKGAQCLI